MLTSANEDDFDDLAQGHQHGVPWDFESVSKNS